MSYWDGRDQEHRQRAPHRAYHWGLCWPGRPQLPSTLCLCFEPSLLLCRPSVSKWCLPVPPPVPPAPAACFSPRRCTGLPHLPASMLAPPTYTWSKPQIPYNPYLICFPTCLSEDICCQSSSSPSCSLTDFRSVPHALGLGHTWAFAFAGPSAWNVLPHVFHHLAPPSSFSLDVSSSRKPFPNPTRIDSPPSVILYQCTCFVSCIALIPPIMNIYVFSSPTKVSSCERMN